MYKKRRRGRSCNKTTSVLHFSTYQLNSPSSVAHLQDSRNDQSNRRRVIFFFAKLSNFLLFCFHTQFSLAISLIFRWSLTVARSPVYSSFCLAKSNNKRLSCPIHSVSWKSTAKYSSDKFTRNPTAWPDDDRFVRSCATTTLQFTTSSSPLLWIYQWSIFELREKTIATGRSSSSPVLTTPLVLLEERVQQGRDNVRKLPSLYLYNKNR